MTACSTWWTIWSKNPVAHPELGAWLVPLRWCSAGIAWLLAGSALAVPPVAASVQDSCLKFAQRLGSVYASDCAHPRWYASGHYSVGGEPILLRDVDVAPGQTERGRVLVVGGIHGDELSSVSIVFAWLRALDQSSINDYSWRITPSMNPDGVLPSEAQRTNANGVDLNRNFPTPNWDEEAKRYWVDDTYRNPRRYPGPGPLSEPESRWLVSEIERFAPHVVVAVHAPFGIVDFDGPSRPPPRLGQLRLNLLGTYPGSLGNYAGVQRDIPVLTVELPSAGSMPSASEQERIWLDLNAWLRRRIPAPQPPREIAQPAGQ